MSRKRYNPGTSGDASLAPAWINVAAVVAGWSGSGLSIQTELPTADYLLLPMANNKASLTVNRRLRASQASSRIRGGAKPRSTTLLRSSALLVIFLLCGVGHKLCFDIG